MVGLEDSAHHLRRIKAAGEALPPSKLLTGPASPRRLVCAPKRCRCHCIADRLLKRETRSMWFTSQIHRRRAGRALARDSRFRPRLELLEGRDVPSTLTVLNNHDSGAGSLRDAIGHAHDGDTIVFAPSLDGQIIALTSDELA